MDGYRDKDMGDIILGELFCKSSCVEARRFDGLTTIHNGSDNVTYQMARSHPRFKHLSNAQCNKIKPLLKVSMHDKLNGNSYPYQKLKSFYKGVLNLGPEYVRDAKIEEWLTRGHISVHEMESKEAERKKCRRSGNRGRKGVWGKQGEHTLLMATTQISQGKNLNLKFHLPIKLAKNCLHMDRMREKSALSLKMVSPTNLSPQLAPKGNFSVEKPKHFISDGIWKQNGSNNRGEMAHAGQIIAR
ncbi:hypothetical protein Tco_0690238 [Tanacetum coccineum]